MNKIISLFLLFLFILISLNAQDFSVAPVRVDFKANPGESENQSITIKNHGNKELSLLLSMRDFLMKRDGSKEFLETESTNHSIAEFITINPNYLELNPNESANVQLNLQAPVNDMGSKWGVLTVTSSREQEAFSADDNLQASFNISGSVSVFVYHSPQANQNYEVKISNLAEMGQTDSTRNFSAIIDNTGDKRARCKMFLIAANLNTGKEQQFNQSTVIVYPNTTREVTLTLPRSLSKGRYSLSAVLDYGGSTLEGTQMIIQVPPAE